MGADGIQGTLDDDFHLQSTAGSWQGGAWVPDANDSPCIDAGDPAYGVGAEPIPNGSRINMGAYGGTPEASKSAARTVFHVSKNGRDSNNGRSPSKAFATIDKAIEAAAD